MEVSKGTVHSPHLFNFLQEQDLAPIVPHQDHFIVSLVGDYWSQIRSKPTTISLRLWWALYELTPLLPTTISFQKNIVKQAQI